LETAQRPISRLLSRLASFPELVPGIAAAAVFIVWAVADGGALATDSYPGGVFLLGLLAAVAYGYRTRLPEIPRLSLMAIGLLAGFTLWNFLSIAWADDQGAAWDGANRCLLYLSVFTLFSIPRWGAGAAATLLGLYVLGLAAVAAITLLSAAASANPLEFLVAGRFSEPAGYHNANTALLTVGIFPAIFLASRREVPWVARGLMLASAGVLFQGALLPQSRGWLIAAPVGLVAYLLFVPRPARSLIVLAPLAIVAALSAGPMIDVYDAGDDVPRLMAALDSARDAIMLAAGALFVIGAAIGFAATRVELSERTIRAGSRIVLALAGIAALAGAIVAISVIGNPVSWAGDRFDDVTSGELEEDFEGSRLGQPLGSNRWDFWRVAVDQFEDSPLTGVGAENFAQDYVRDRDSEEEPTHPHSLPLRTLGQTGVIGTALFAGFLIASLIAVGKVRPRSADTLARGVAGLVAAVLCYWLVHSTGDWFWAFPAITAPIFALLGLGTRLGDERATLPDPNRTRRATPVRAGAARPAIGGAVAAAIGLLALVSLLLPWRAEVDVEKAAESWGRNPQGAFDRLDRARKLNFLSSRPDLVEGAIAAQLGDRPRMRSSFDRALERDPRNWYATLELAALDALEGDRRAALAGLARVSELNPDEEATELVRRGTIAGRPVSLEHLQALFLERYCARLGRVPDPEGCRTG
jgi:hypothetical protein